MVPRPSLSTALVSAGVVLLLISAVPISGGSTEIDYAHRVEPATNGTLKYGLEYDESDVLAYENLSERGQTVFDRARSDSPYIIENESATAPDFRYTSDHVAVGEGLYPIRYAGDTYSLRTARQGEGRGFVTALLLPLLADVLRVVSAALVIAGTLLAGWRWHTS